MVWMCYWKQWDQFGARCRAQLRALYSQIVLGKEIFQWCLLQKFTPWYLENMDCLGFFFTSAWVFPWTTLNLFPQIVQWDLTVSLKWRFGVSTAPDLLTSYYREAAAEAGRQREALAGEQLSLSENRAHGRTHSCHFNLYVKRSWCVTVSQSQASFLEHDGCGLTLTAKIWGPSCGWS